ncbi:YibE/F family protein [Gordonia hydrophobica]|uniref:YibE/F family protein n=1 Tax=Gordonia hydrophobica TaxID=40516 RepID=A0ABZ2U2V9_9ACTN|nr:YibE/F family protein [Gordonia hydrophobica]MBM7369034.1 putative membrane protein [Gordonia hydrophobica]
MSHRLPEPEPTQNPTPPRAERSPSGPVPRAAASSHHHHHDHGGELPGQLARYAKPVVVAILVAAAVAVGIGAIALWPSHAERPIPMQFRSVTGGPIQTFDAEVVSQRKADCSAPSVGVASPDLPTLPAEQGPCRASTLQLTSGPDRDKYVLLMVATNASQTGADSTMPGTVAATTGAPDDPQPGQPKLEVNDKIRVTSVPGPDGRALYSFYDYQRGTSIIGWAIAFILAIVAVATWRGARAIAALAVAFAVLGFFTLPSVLDGNSVVAVAVVSAAAILFVVLYLAHGFSMRTSSALLGTLASLLLAVLLSALAIATMSLTGLSTESTASLQVYQGTISLNGLLLAGFVIGTIGVLNDVTITQASATFELAAMPGQTRATAFRAAMRVGRDHIASTVYTLVFAYAGSALPLLLLFSVAGQPFGSLITSEEVAIELARAFVGGIAIAGSVPLTTAIAAMLVVPGAAATRTASAAS